MLKLLYKYHERSNVSTKFGLRIIIPSVIIPIFDNSWGVFAWGVLMLLLLNPFFRNPFASFPQALTLAHLTGCNMLKYLKAVGLSILIQVNFFGLIVLLVLYWRSETFEIIPALYTLFSINSTSFVLFAIGNALYFSSLKMKNYSDGASLSFTIILASTSIIMGLLFLGRDFLLSIPLVMILIAGACFSLWYFTLNRYIAVKHYKLIKSQ